MSNITCPLCGAPVTARAFFGQVKPFCTHCGWNLERVQSSLNAKSRIAPLLAAGFGILAVSLVLVTSSTRGGAHLIPIIPIFLFFLLVGGIPYWGYVSNKRAIAAAKAVVPMQGVQTQPIPDGFMQRVQTLSRPRRVRFSFPGAAAGVVVFAFGMIIFIMFLATTRVRPSTVPQHAAPFPYFAVFGPIAFIALILGIVIVPALVREKRNRPLFQDGEVAAARVIAQHTVMQGKTSYSQIEYEFRAADGQTIKNTERDLSQKVFEDMLIPVFYDPVNPSRCVALCASYSKLPDAEG